MRKALLLATVAALATGCYTDPSTGRIVFGRKPSGPTEEQLRMQRMEQTINELQNQNRSLRNELDDVGTSMNDVAARSEQNNYAIDARGQDVVALRAEIATLRNRVASLEGQLAKVPQAITAAVSSEHQSIVSEVNKAIAASDARTATQIQQALRQSAQSRPASGGGGSGRASSGPSGATSSDSFYEYEVQSGQTLSEIARAFNCTVKEIMQASGISDAAKIRAGQKIYIPAK
ncbi:MAG: LysM peptidoglycan-binding domain-containing protein [Kiritimatiellae bacterium]|nr:LysM peptidoglycan-binding domain-containing protein [Kiritimatiellia bacterium]MBQ6924105.1 LysM peptidoglycan-binding domain-containing protein [Kiritimatiellia bacterium]